MSILEQKLDKQLIISDFENNKKLVKEINYCIDNKIRYMFVIAENEYKDNKIIFKDLKSKTQETIDI